MPRPSTSVLSVLVAVLSTTNAVCSEQGQVTTFDYRQITLENGLEVISLEDFSCPIVSVQLWYHVGSKDEDPQRQGFAHMFEHMMFRGTDRLGSTDHFDFIRKTGGNCNAYTTFDQTVYYENLPANQLELALWLEAERMSMLKIDQESFDTERKVVEEERRMGLNRPYGTLMEKVLPIAFPDHPYHWSTIGSIPHLRATSVPELRDFWTKYYVPGNATLVVVGARKHQEVQELAKQYFGWIPRYETPQRVAAPDLRPFESREITIKEQNAPAPLVGVAYRGVPLGHEDYYALDLLTTILGGGESSRLYRRIVADDESAVMAMAGAMSLEQDGVIGAAAVLQPFGGDADKVLATIHEEIERLSNEPASQAELTKARNQTLKRLVLRNLSISSKANALASAAVLEGDVSRVNRQIDEIRGVTVDDLSRVAQEYLDPGKSITGRVNRNLLGSLAGLLGFGKDKSESAPITGEKETDPPAPGRVGVDRPAEYPAQAPIAGLLEYDPTPHFEEATLDNGLRIVVVDNHEVPFITATLGLKSGAWTESKPGSASMAMGMLTKGTSKHSEAELAEELETYAISLVGSAGRDTSSVSMNCLPDNIDRAVGLMAEVVLSPTIAEDEFKKLRKQVRTGLTISQNEPSYLASREFRRRLYGDHPYARSVSGEIKDVDALTVDDLRQWWQSVSRPDEAHLVFAGDIDLRSALEFAEEHFGDWQAGDTAAVTEMADLPARSDTNIFIVDHPGKQTQIRVGQLALTRSDPDYFVSRVVSSYFGGAFSSRLNETIRVKKGLTYGANGGFSAARFAGSFAISTFSKNDSAVEAVKAILAEITRLQAEPPSEKEINTTKSYFVGSFPAQSETPQQVAGDLWFIESNDLPSDYFEQLLNGVSSASADQCLQVSKNRIDVDKLIIVLAGPAKQLEQGLKDIGPVTVVKK